jgi:predicted HicB family RNase H-like nuclease
VSKKRPAPEPVPPGDHFIRLGVSAADHAAIHILAAKAGMSMAAYVRWLIRDHVAKEAK